MLMHFFLVDLVDLRTPVNFATKNIIIIITVWSSSTGARHRPARSEVEDKLLCTLHGRTMVQLPSHVAQHTHNGRGTRAYYRLNYFNYEINYPDVFSLRRWAPSRSKVSPRPATDYHRNVRTVAYRISFYFYLSTTPLPLAPHSHHLHWNLETSMQCRTYVAGCREHLCDRNTMCNG